MVEKICSALSRHHGQLVAFDDRNHHSSQVDRAHRCDGGGYDGMGVVLVVRRADVWVGEPCWQIERKPFSRVGEKIRREERDCSARAFSSYHLGHPCTAPQAQIDVPVAALQTLIDLLAEVVRSDTPASGHQTASAYAGGSTALKTISMSCSGKASLDTPIRLLAH